VDTPIQGESARVFILLAAGHYRRYTLDDNESSRNEGPAGRPILHKSNELHKVLIAAFRNLLYNPHTKT
jgi:hypothetical protein